MDIAVCILSKSSDSYDKEFAKEIAIHYDTFVVIDNEVTDFTYYTVLEENRLTLISVNEESCFKFGFHSSNVTGTHIKKNPVALDKALFYFCIAVSSYDYVLFVEDDVFIPSVAALIKLIEENKLSDLTIPFNLHKRDTIWDWHWKEIINKIPPPYFYSMACVVGLSKSMLNVIKNYVAENKTLIYLEVMFNTLAHHHKLKISNPKELRSITFNGFWAENDFSRYKYNLFHPVKNIKKHIYYRNLNYDKTICHPCSMEHFFPIKYQNRMIRI